MDYLKIKKLTKMSKDDQFPPALFGKNTKANTKAKKKKAQEKIFKEVVANFKKR